MRLMFKLMNEVGSQMSNTLREQINCGADNKFEFKELARKFTVDIIGSTAFGLEVIQRNFKKIREKAFSRAFESFFEIYFSTPILNNFYLLKFNHRSIPSKIQITIS